MTETAGTTREQPLFFKLVHDDDGKIHWGRVILTLGLAAATAYISMSSQRAAASPDLRRTIIMATARKRITFGMQLQRAGRAVEEAGWAAYEAAKG